MSIPLKDTLLVWYVTNFDRLLNEAGESYLVTPEQAAAFSLLCGAYVESMNTLVKARESGVRSSPQTLAKESAKAALLPALRGYYAQISNSPDISGSAKAQIGVHVRKDGKSRRAAPTTRPSVHVLTTVGRSIRLSISDLGSLSSRRKGDNATHAYVWSYVGDEAPTDRTDWRFHGEATTNRFSLTLPKAVPNGAQVWVCSCWVSARGEVGPLSNPVMTNIQGGSALPATMQLAA